MHITLTGLILGIINIGIVVAILLLLGALAVWLLSLIAGISIPGEVRRLYIVIVALVALYMVAALLLGMPTVHVLAGSMGR